MSCKHDEATGPGCLNEPHEPTCPCRYRQVTEERKYEDSVKLPRCLEHFWKRRGYKSTRTDVALNKIDCSWVNVARPEIGARIDQVPCYTSIAAGKFKRRVTIL